MLAYIALGGILGTGRPLRASGLDPSRAGPTTFPVGTLTINLIGSLVLGFVLRYATGSTVISPEVRGALTIGFCGAFTTMSTFSYETMTLLRDSQYWHAGLYMGGTILGCLTAVIVGTALANRLL